LTTQENAAVIRRFAEKVITEGLVDSVGEFVWEDVVEQVPLHGQGPGLQGLTGILRVMRPAFPDLEFSVKEQIAEGDKVASRFEWTGTHKREMLLKKTVRGERIGRLTFNLIVLPFWGDDLFRPSLQPNVSVGLETLLAALRFGPLLPM
jgi:predicted ester cyclase